MLIQNTTERGGCGGRSRLQQWCRWAYRRTRHSYRYSVGSLRRSQAARVKERCCTAQALVADPKQERPYRSHRVWQHAEPDGCYQGSSEPDEEIPDQVPGHVMDEYVERQMLGHVRRVELCEPERSLAKLAVLLLRMRQPLHQAVLVDIFYTTTTLARKEERLVVGGFASAYSTGVDIHRGVVSPRVTGGYHIVLDVCSCDVMGLRVRGIARFPMPRNRIIHCDCLKRRLLANLK